MNKRVELNESHTLQLGRGIQLRDDKARGGWVLVAPERVLVLDEISHEVLVETLKDSMTIGDVISILAERFSAPREEIGKDVLQMLQSFTDKKMLIADEPA